MTMENPESALDDILILSSSAIFALSLLSTTFLYGLNFDLELSGDEKKGIIFIFIALSIMLAYNCEKILKKIRICKNFFKSQYIEDEFSSTFIPNLEGDVKTEHATENSHNSSNFPSKYSRRFSFPMQPKDELYFRGKNLAYNEVSSKPLNENIFKTAQTPQNQSLKIPNGTEFQSSRCASVLRNCIKGIDDITMKVKYLNEMYKSTEDMILMDQVSTIESKELDLCPDFKKKDVADPFESQITRKLEKLPNVRNTFNTLHQKINENINSGHSTHKNMALPSEEILPSIRHGLSRRDKKRSYETSLYEEISQNDKSESDLVAYENGYANLHQGTQHNMVLSYQHGTRINESSFYKQKENMNFSENLIKYKTHELHLKPYVDDINVNRSFDKISSRNKRVLVDYALNNRQISLETKSQILSDVSTNGIKREMSNNTKRSFYKSPNKIHDFNSEQSIQKNMTVLSNDTMCPIKGKASRFWKKKKNETSFKDIPQNQKSKPNLVPYAEENKFITFPQRTQDGKLLPNEDLDEINETFKKEMENITPYSQNSNSLPHESYIKPYTDNINATFFQTFPIYKLDPYDHFLHNFKLDDLSGVKETASMSYRRNLPKNINRKLHLEYRTGIDNSGLYLLKLPKLEFTFFSLIQKVSELNVEQKQTCVPFYESKPSKSQSDMRENSVKQRLPNIPMRRSMSKNPKKRCERLLKRKCYEILPKNLNEQPIILEAESLTFQDTSTENERTMDIPMISMFVPIISRDLSKISMNTFFISVSEQANLLEAEPVTLNDTLINRTEEEISMDMSLISMILPKVSFDLTEISMDEGLASGTFQ